MEREQLATLRRWAEGLAGDDRPEVRAAAKAILLLVEEVESLRSALLTEMGSSAAEAGPEPSGAEAEPSSGDAVERDLRARLRTFARRRLGRA